jgi:hypothetical protein
VARRHCCGLDSRTRVRFVTTTDVELSDTGLRVPLRQEVRALQHRGACRWTRRAMTPGGSGRGRD